MSHSVRNRPHRARNQAALSLEMGEDAPAKVAARAAAAAGRALGEGRVAEAERLGRLAANMKKLAPAATAPVEEGEDAFEADGGTFASLSARCTPGRCHLKKAQDRMVARLDEIDGWFQMHAVPDVRAWAAMATDMGVEIADPDLRHAVAVLTADCLQDIDDGVRAICQAATG